MELLYWEKNPPVGPGDSHLLDLRKAAQVCLMPLINDELTRCDWPVPLLQIYLAPFLIFIIDVTPENMTFRKITVKSAKHGHKLSREEHKVSHTSSKSKHPYPKIATAQHGPLLQTAVIKRLNANRKKSEVVRSWWESHTYTCWYLVQYSEDFVGKQTLIYRLPRCLGVSVGEKKERLMQQEKE